MEDHHPEVLHGNFDQPLDIIPDALAATIQDLKGEMISRPLAGHAESSVCWACKGSGMLELVQTHPCKNCSGLGYCSTQRSNKFVCSICNGQGQRPITLTVICEHCRFTGNEPKSDPVLTNNSSNGNGNGNGNCDGNGNVNNDNNNHNNNNNNNNNSNGNGNGNSNSNSKPVVKPLSTPDNIERVQCDTSRGVVIDLRLTPTCLTNTAGVAFIISGILVLLTKVWVVAALLLLAGCACIVGAFGRRAMTSLKRASGIVSLTDSSKQVCRASEDSADLDMGLPDLQAKEYLTCDQVIAIVTVVVIPNMILIYGCSDMGIGLETYSSFAPQHMRIVGDIISSVGCVFAATCLVFDWIHWRVISQVISAVIPATLFVSATFLKSLVYPWAPILMLMTLILAGLGLLRVTSCRSVMRSSYYTMISVIMGVCSLLLLVSWLVWITLGDNEWTAETRHRLVQACKEVYEHAYFNSEERLDHLDYDTHCIAGADLSAYSKETQTEIRSACSTAATVLFLVYASPLVAFVCNLIVCMFCFMQGVVMGDINDFNRNQKILKQFVVMAVLCLAGVYASVNLSPASFRLGSTILAFVAAGFAAFLFWGYMEIGTQTLEKAATECAFMHIIIDIWHSDWTKAMLLVGFNLLIPCFFGLNMITMSVRKWRRITDDKDKFTPLGRTIFDEIAAWDLSTVMNKVCILAELFFVFNVGVGKLTAIFLSWLNSEMSSFGLGTVILLVVAVGLTMFLLPPVPGLPVYVFAGILISNNGDSTPGVGYGGGIAIAVVLSFLMKLVACAMQYGIGFFLGKSLRIQQLIGVDKTFTRAIEAILKEPGLTAGKVAILVGGPDWPTSVTCGILRMNLPQMIMGTVPVVMVTTPCVLGGAFMTKTEPGKDNIWNPLSQFAVGVATIANLVSSCLAAFIVLDVISKRQEELSQPRPEHAAVAELTRQGEQRARMYQDVTNWYHLSGTWRAVIATAMVLHVVAGFCFVFAAEACFRDFSVSSNIGDPIPDGLGGDWLNVVKSPVGWITIGIFVAACILHYVWNKAMSVMTDRRMNGMSVGGDAHCDDPPAYDGEFSQPGETYVTEARI